MKICTSYIVFTFSFLLFLYAKSYCQGALNLKPIDQYASKTPATIQRDYVKLAAYLTAPYDTDLEKIRSIYSWIVQNIEYDRRGLKVRELSYNYDPNEILEKRRAICTGYARLFQKMCEQTGLQSEIILGYTKSKTEPNKKFESPDHAWNAVMVNGNWQLIDATWGAGLSIPRGRRKSINDEYFLIPPQEFLNDHLPAMPMWQLMACPISVDSFIKYSSLDFPLINSIQCYHFQDSIDHFVNLSDSNKRLKRAKESFRFHPTSLNS